MKSRHLLLWSLLALIPILRAENLLELDFQNVNGTETYAVTAAPGASQLAELQNGAQIDLEPTGISSGIPALQKGSLLIDRQMSGGCLSLKSTSGTKRSNAYFESYANAKGFGSGTLLLVFRPNFSKAELQNALVCSNASATEGGHFAWRARGNGIYFVIGGKGVSSKVEIPDVGWSADQWYFLGVSWQENSPPTIFLRPLGGSGRFAIGEKPAISGGAVNYPVRIGNSEFLREELPENEMDGRLAYLLWTSNYSGVERDYQALYEQIVEGK